MIYAIDFGTNDALIIHGQDGEVSKKSLKMPRVPGGRTPAMEFTMVVESLFNGSDENPPGDVVTESATIGSSGCEIADVLDLLSRFPERSLFTLPTRAVKNYRADHGLAWKKTVKYAKDNAPPPVIQTLEEKAAVHKEDAEILYRIATETPYRLHLWSGPSAPAERIHRSVRPMDKRLYRDERSESFMLLLPPFANLPSDMQEVLGNGKKKNDYSRSMVMPFAMASTEPEIDNGDPQERRRRYEKVIGLYDRGYPSFYRRATIVWMTKNAKIISGKRKKEDIDAATRKEAWKLTQRQVRRFFHMTMAHQSR